MKILFLLKTDLVKSEGEISYLEFRMLEKHLKILIFFLDLKKLFDGNFM